VQGVRATAILDRLQAAQNAFYGGGDRAELRTLLADDVVSAVPGASAIVGTYQGRRSGLGLLHTAQRHHQEHIRLHRRDVLAGIGDMMAALTDGIPAVPNHLRSASLNGQATQC
jgi:hypothetical protein